LPVPKRTVENERWSKKKTAIEGKKKGGKGTWAKNIAEEIRRGGELKKGWKRDYFQNGLLA